MSIPAGFDELIHPATRLSVVALLATTEWADFAFVRDSLAQRLGALQTTAHPGRGRIPGDPQVRAAAASGARRYG